MKAADIDTGEFLAFIANLSAEKVRTRDNISGWVFTWDLEKHWPDVPPKVLLAKARILIKEGKAQRLPLRLSRGLHHPNTAPLTVLARLSSAGSRRNAREDQP